MIVDGEYINGYIMRQPQGFYRGELTIDGVNLEGGIEAVFFKQDGDTYLWLKRRALLQYDISTDSYSKRDRKPKWEAYLKKQVEDNTTVFKGTFYFMRFKYSIKGYWDKVFGKDDSRLNLYVEELPMKEQDIINGIRNRNNK